MPIRASVRSPRSALILGGGGVLGGAYELGFLAALEERFGRGCLQRHFDLFIGTSAGSLVAAIIAQGISPARFYRSSLAGEPVFRFRSRDLCSVAWGRIASGLAGFLWGLFSAALSSARRGRFPHPLLLLLEGGRRLPAGFLTIEPLERWLQQMFHSQGLPGRFSALRKPLLIPALDLDRGQRVVFGGSPATDPGIARAVAASCALPRLFAPVEIGGRFFLDGAIGTAPPLELALERGVRRLVFFNPMVASCEPSLFADAGPAPECRQVSRCGSAAVLAQCRKLDHEAAVTTALEAARARHPEAEILLIQPRREEMFSQGTMDHGAYREVLERGYRSLEVRSPLFLERLAAFFPPVGRSRDFGARTGRRNAG